MVRPNSPGVEQIRAAELSTAELYERLRAELPRVVIGNEDALHPTNTAYPNVLYHGTGRSFDLNGDKDYRTTPPTTGARTGRGFYCAAEQVASLFGGTDKQVVAIYPQQAEIIDLTDPQVDQPLSDDFRQTYAAFQQKKLEEDTDPAVQEAFRYAQSEARPSGLVSAEESAAYIKQAFAARKATGKLNVDQKVQLLHKIQETFSRVNARSIMSDPETSLRTLFALHDNVSGPTKYQAENPVYDVATSLDFLVGELGIDGAKTIQSFKPKPAESSYDEDILDDDPVPVEIPDIDPDLWHGYVFWKLDRVGDRDLWEQRAEEHRTLGSIAVEQPTEVISEKAHAPRPELQGEFRLGLEDVRTTIDKLQRGEPLLQTETASELITMLEAEQIDPYDVVAAMAGGSKELATLLHGDVGLVTERFRLHEHTQAVMGQFEQVFASSTPPAERKVLRTALLLQDIGKSLATTVTGNKENQTDYNVKVAASILQAVPKEKLSDADKRVILGLIGQDIIGSALQNKIDDTQAHEQFKALTQSLAEVADPEIVSRYAQILYSCDTRAYTSAARFVDASGEARSPRQPTLNYLFLRPHGRVSRLKPRIQQRIDTIVAA